jgi:hypothetical protein
MCLLHACDLFAVHCFLVVMVFIVSSMLLSLSQVFHLVPTGDSERRKQANHLSPWASCMSNVSWPLMQSIRPIFDFCSNSVECLNVFAEHKDCLIKFAHIMSV